MRTFSWLKALRKSERGNVLAIGAAAMPLLIGSAALAVDSVQLTLWKRQLQRAADSGAIAGAYALSQGASQDSAVANDLDEHIQHDLQENEAPVIASLSILNGSFAEQTLSTTQNCAARSLAEPDCFNRSVQVTLTSQRSLPLISTLRGLLLQDPTPTTIVARGTAALVSSGEYCLISLYNGSDPGITVKGNATVSLGCGMSTNSRAAQAVTAGGSSEVTATPIGAVGGLDGAGQNFVGETQLLPYTAPTADPLAHLPDPVIPAGACPAFSDSPGNTTQAEPGCYSSMDIKGSVTLQPGTYYINGGDVSFGSQAVITGTGVTIVMTGPNGKAGDMKVNGGASINISSPSTGPYPGVVMYRDRRADVIEVKFNGGADIEFKGALYMPTTDFSMMGNFAMDSQCLQLIGRILNFSGTADLKNDDMCDPSTGAGSFETTIVKLVG